MSAGSLTDALRDAGPHTAASLAERLPFLAPSAIGEALEVLVVQGVLERVPGVGDTATYRYVAPDRYVQANFGVVQDPAARFNRVVRPGSTQGEQ